FAVAVVCVLKEMRADFNTIAGLAAVSFNIVGVTGGGHDDLLAAGRSQDDGPKLVHHIDAGVAVDRVLEFFVITGCERIRAEYGDACDQTFCVSTLHIVSPCIRSSSRFDGAGPRSQPPRQTIMLIFTANLASPSHT